MRDVCKVGTFVLAAIIAACATGPDETAPRSFDPDDPLAELTQGLSPLTTACVFDKTSGEMTVAIKDNETAVVSRNAVDSSILQNGQPCVDADGKPITATASTLKRLVVAGTAAKNTLVLDFTNGLFATGTSSGPTKSGIDVSLGDDAGDTLAIKGTAGADNFMMGAAAILVNTDKFPDIKYAGVKDFIVSLGAGNDVFSAAGEPSAVAGGPFILGVSVYGGTGNNTFNQGAAPTPGEKIFGGPDLDTVSYASRSAPVTVTIGAGADDGDVAGSGEKDDLDDNVEVVVGGDGDDSLTASAKAATLNGGPGDDTLTGGDGNDTLNGGPGEDKLYGKDGDDVLNGDDGNDELTGGDGDDKLNGGAGDDTFFESVKSDGVTFGPNGGDLISGGAGIDTVDYSQRTTALKVTMDGKTADDGDVAANEKDNVKADVENINGGDGDDDITGNALNNVITGGKGANILRGGAGDDVFPQGAAGKEGTDTIEGGPGIDTVDYSARSAAITAVLDGATESGDPLVSEKDKLGTDVENLWGGSGDDTLTGNDSDNELVGNGGDDTLEGGKGDDTLEGGAGADIHKCGDGFDVVVGNAGDDLTGTPPVAYPDQDCEVK